jgi:hypothetical protein
MAGFPLAWEVAPSMDRLPEESPYSLAEIEEYLFNCHYRWVVREEPITFKASGPCVQKDDSERRYWLFKAVDLRGEQEWLVVIGSGKGFSGSDKAMRRWMYAETNDDDLSPEQFLDQAIIAVNNYDKTSN